MAKMTEDQKREYKLYRRACRISNVEPVRADFLAGDILSCVRQDMEEARPKVMSAAAGR